MRKKHFHLIGVSGTAMGSLAGMLKAQGHRVTGSDKAFYPPMSDELKRLGIETFEGFDAAHLNPQGGANGAAPDVVVVGNATSRSNTRSTTNCATPRCQRSSARASFAANTRRSWRARTARRPRLH